MGSVGRVDSECRFLTEKWVPLVAISAQISNATRMPSFILESTVSFSRRGFGLLQYVLHSPRNDVAAGQELEACPIGYLLLSEAWVLQKSFGLSILFSTIAFARIYST